MKRNTKVFAIVAFGIMIASGGLMAAATMPDTIKLENPEYTDYSKPIVEFPHQKHTSEFQTKYPSAFSDGCGTCHHDDDGRALSALAPGDDVTACIECHSNPGRVPREIKKQMRQQNLSLSEKRSQELEYHAEAMHDLCRGCHRKIKKENRSTVAPTTCFKCHKRKA